MSASPRASTFDARVRLWAVVLVPFGVGIAYALLNSNRRFGPAWLLPIAVLALLISAILAHETGHVRLSRASGLITVGLLTLAVGSSVVQIVLRMLGIVGGGATAPGLFRDAILLWCSNVAVFALWYWELDGGGPLKRGHSYRPTDFAFPQTAMQGKEFEGWSPNFVDYLFLAFNTSTAFSPTETMFLSNAAKVLAMIQSSISLMTVAVVAARAVGSLKT
jgi:hypothetical protein